MLITYLFLTLWIEFNRLGVIFSPFQEHLGASLRGIKIQGMGFLVDVLLCCEIWDTPSFVRYTLFTREMIFFPCFDDLWVFSVGILKNIMKNFKHRKNLYTYYTNLTNVETSSPTFVMGIDGFWIFSTLLDIKNWTLIYV